MNGAELKDLLEEKYRQYNHNSFIEHDPVSIPRRLSKKVDIEVAEFLAATIAWGQRPVIIKNATRLVEMMEMAPHDFILNFSAADPEPFAKFVHRTFSGTDCMFF